MRDKIGEGGAAQRGEERIGSVLADAGPAEGQRVRASVSGNADKTNTWTDGEARRWFKDLKLADRVLAAGNADLSFLMGLAKVLTRASPSRNYIEGRESTEGRPRSDSINWEVELAPEVLLKAITGVEMETDRLLSATEKNGGANKQATTTMVPTASEEGLTYPGEAEGDRSYMSTEANQHEAESPSTNGYKQSGEGECDTDEFRIRKSEKNPLSNPNNALNDNADSGFATRQATHDVPSDSNASALSLTMNGERAVVDTVGSACIFSPSNKAKMEGSISNPLVIIHPSTTKQKYSNLLTAIDQLNALHPWLSDVISDSISDTVESIIHRAIVAKIPLYVLILLNFQISIVTSYQQRVRQLADAALQPTVDEASADVKESPLSSEQSPRKSTETQTNSSADTRRGALDSEIHDELTQQRSSLPIDDLSLLIQRSAAGGGGGFSWSDIFVPLQSVLEELSFVNSDAELNLYMQRMSDKTTKILSSFSDDENNNQVDTSQEIVERYPGGTVAQSTKNGTVTEGNTPKSNKESLANSLEGDIDMLVHKIENTTSMSGTGGKKNSKKKKRKKKRKDSEGTTENGNESAEKASDSMSRNTADVLRKNDNGISIGNNNVAVAKSPVPEKDHLSEPNIARARNDGTDGDKSIGDDTDVTRSDSTIDAGSDIPLVEKARDEDDGLHISRVDGVGTVVVTPALTEELKVRAGEASGTDTASHLGQDDSNDHDEWETVEVRSRGNRKKADRTNQGRFGSQGSTNNHGSKKKAPRNSESRKRNAKRKMVRDILASVLDAVDEQVRRRRQVANNDQVRRAPVNAWTTKGKGKLSSIVAGKGQMASASPKVGNQKEDLATVTTKNASSKALGDRMLYRPVLTSSKKGRDKAMPASTAADQNTAPTLPETLSAVSTASAVTENLAKKSTAPQQGTTTNESISSGSVEASKAPNTSKQLEKVVSPSPPLPTLLSPGNANSATSSVASSLDAPHGVLHNHHSYPGGEKDVGYHLLHVCDRLTRDIAQFMKRREKALEIRRKERKLVLSALQDTVSRIFPVMSSVEMYGSCATDLDLPSSDLDVVVRGLEKESSDPHSHVEVGSEVKENNKGSPAKANSIQREEKMSRGLQRSPQQNQYPVIYGHSTPNADRVVRLAMDLERQPWAVHVKAIPTASVPVVKILADPARLTGSPIPGNDEWLVHHQLSQSATANVQSSTENMDQMPMYPGNQSLLPWRGADVVNGLLKVDITFEGLEHGGIDSTKFSSRVVQEFSDETGVPADGTPAVQVLMVLKELLAQRRLNEPFSGGLSSYALLLLVVSVVRERSIIRQELERVEKQRRMVAAGGGNAVPRPTTLQNEEPRASKREENTEETISLASRLKLNAEKHQNSEQSSTTVAKSRYVAVDSKSNGTPTQAFGANKAVIPTEGYKGKSTTATTVDTKVAATKTEAAQTAAPSSWASITRRSPPASTLNGTKQSESATANPPLTTKKVSSFADAVAKGKPPTGTVSKGDSGNSRTKKSKTEPVKSPQQPTENRWTKPTVQPDGESAWGTKMEKKALVPAPTSGTLSSGKDTKQVGAGKPKASTIAGDSGTLFPQGFHDVIEVLCSGETTSGKLLMHFLLFYGQHFDAHSTSIDLSGTHQRDAKSNNGYSVSSPYMQRRNTGSYDPMTGMLTVDPIVVYDPLKGAETKNVARSCFAWSSIRWVFAQSYMTLSSAVEMSAGNPVKGKSKRGSGVVSNNGMAVRESSSQPHDVAWNAPYRHDEAGNVIFDSSSPLLELLLSF